MRVDDGTKPDGLLDAWMAFSLSLAAMSLKSYDI
jgi:hypothetical protein